MVNKTGLGIVLKVMAGDAVNIFGKSYHKKPTAGYSGATNNIPVLDLINAFAASGIVSGKGVTGTQITGQPGFPSAMNGLIGNQPAQNSSMPRASINWIVLDEQFKWVSGGFDMVATAADGNGTLKHHNNSTIPTINVSKNGYIYVWVSNESKFDVFFDNLQLIHTRGSILEETHYYPFGLVMSGISSKAAGALTNKKKYNSYELNSDFDINLNESFFRSHDPQIGRFLQIDPKPTLMHSPYVAMGNNPSRFSDPLGDIIVAATEADKADILAANEAVFGKGNFKFNKDNKLEFTGKLKSFKGDAKKALKSYLKEIVNNKDKIQVIGLNDKFDDNQKAAMENHGGGITVINPVGPDGKQIISTAIEKNIANATQIPVVEKQYTYIDNDGKVQSTNVKPEEGTYKGTVVESYANKIKDGKYATVPTNVTTTYFHEVGHGMYPNSGKATLQFDNQIRALQGMPLRSAEDVDHNN